MAKYTRRDKDKPFHDMIRIWVRQEDAGGAENLQHKEQNRIHDG